jgi:hypothetical protein
MLTIYDLVQFATTTAGAVIGYRVGGLSDGHRTALAGAAAGALLGWFIGRLPQMVARTLVWCSIKRQSSTELREALDEQYVISHLIIAELVKRGEPAESFRDVIEAQMESPFEEVRQFGYANAELWLAEPTDEAPAQYRLAA